MFQPKTISLPILTPKTKIKPQESLQKITFHREFVEIEKQG